MNIGFMQGRLVDQIDGRIQAFPVQHWRDEFRLGHELGFSLIEWTLDYEGLHNNPFLTTVGHNEIKQLCIKYDLGIESVTCDCFMQKPFWKNKHYSENLMKDFDAVLQACAVLGLRFVVIPLVDNGRLENNEEQVRLIELLSSREQFMADNGLQIIFESDYDPARYTDFLKNLSSNYYNVNYDIGNSASLGYDSDLEISLYGKRIKNVHVKDRMYQGTTVPLGEGAADFPKVFHALSNVGYQGNFILQTARAKQGEHCLVAMNYLDKIKQLISHFYGSRV